MCNAKRLSALAFELIDRLVIDFRQSFRLLIDNMFCSHFSCFDASFKKRYNKSYAINNDHFGFLKFSKDFQIMRKNYDYFGIVFNSIKLLKCYLDSLCTSLQRKCDERQTSHNHFFQFSSKNSPQPYWLLFDCRLAFMRNSIKWIVQHIVPVSHKYTHRVESSRLRKRK